MRYKKRQQEPPATKQPLYHHGMRTDDPNYVLSAGVHIKSSKRGRPPMDPRYPPARYARSNDYAYRGPAVVLPSHQTAPLIHQPPIRKTFIEEWPNWWIWLIVSSVIIGICVALIMVILYVLGELTGESPVYKGHFG